MLAALSRTYRQAYSGLPRAAWLQALVELVNRTGMMVLFFMTLYATSVLGLTVVQAGRIMSAYGLGALAGAWLGGYLSDRIGSYHVQKLSLAISALVLVALTLPRSTGPLAALMFLLAVAAEALHPANMSAMASIVPAEQRSRGFALHRLAVNLGISIGPVAGGFLALWSYAALFWVDAFTSLAAAVLLVLLFPMAGPHGEGPPPAPLDARSPWRDRPFLLLLLISFAVGLVFAQFLSTFPLYLHEAYGLPESRIGPLVAVNTLLIVAVEMVLMHRLERRRPARVAALGALLLCTGFGLMPFGRSVTYAVVTVIVWTFGEILTIPILATLVANRADGASQGRYQGLFSLAFASSLTLGPGLGTQVWVRFGPDKVWYLCLAVGPIVAATLLLLDRLLPEKPDPGVATRAPGA